MMNYPSEQASGYAGGYYLSVLQKGKNMKKIFLLLLVVTLLINSGCKPRLLNNSTIMERPTKQIKDFLIVIEKPGFTAPPIKNIQDNGSRQVAIDRYIASFHEYVNRDFVRVMQDNGISSKLVFVPKISTVTSTPLTLLPPEDLSKWSYILWIRHEKVLISTYLIKGEYFYSAAFQISATIYDTKTRRILWKAEEAPKIFYDRSVWETGRIYKNLLERLQSDCMISLPKNEPVVTISESAVR